MMSHDLINLTKKMEVGFQTGPLKNLEPYFELVGSLAERTRIGLSNEIDIHLQFRALKDIVMLKVDGDPFSLKRADSSSSIPLMEQFFVGKEFHFHRFLHFLLETTESEIEAIYEEKNNPPRE